MESQKQLIAHCGAGFALGPDMLIEEQLSENTHLWRSLSPNFGGPRVLEVRDWILPVGNQAQNALGLVSRFVGCQVAMTAELVEAPSAVAPVALGSIPNEVGLGAALFDLNAKATKFAVPNIVPASVPAW